MSSNTFGIQKFYLQPLPVSNSGKDFSKADAKTTQCGWWFVAAEPSMIFVERDGSGEIKDGG